MKKYFILVVSLLLITLSGGEAKADSPLSIGCGCQSLYNRCLDGDCCHACQTAADPSFCCKGLRDDCHGTGIRISIGFLSSGVIGDGENFQTTDYYSLSQLEKDRFSAYDAIIQDFENGLPLTEAQYAFLDEDHRDE